MRVYSARIRRYQTSTKRKNDNRVFVNNEKIFYRGLGSGREGEEKEEVPQLEEVKEFWENIWTVPTEHNDRALWIKEEVEHNKKKGLKEMEEPVIKVEELKRILARMQNWKTPGVDGIQNFWCKKM